MSKVSNNSENSKEKKEHKNWTEVHSSFEEMELDDNILRGIIHLVLRDQVEFSKGQ